MEEKFIDVLGQNILNEVKNKVKLNYVVIEGNKEKETDHKMLEIIKSVIEDNTFNYKKEEKINFYVFSSLIQYYMALYNDNVDLLKTLLNNNFDFECDHNYIMKLFVLDRRISSNFEVNEYLEVLNNDTKVFRDFYYSLYFSKSNDIKIINNFCECLKKDKDVARIQGGPIFTNGVINDFFSPYLLSKFTSDEIVNFSVDQKRLLADLKNNETSKKLVKLVKNYNFSKYFYCQDDFCKYFTVKELLKLTCEDIKVYEEVFSSQYMVPDLDINKILEKIKFIKHIKPDYNYCLDAAVYEALDFSEIIFLTKEGVLEINNCLREYGYRELEFHQNLSKKTLFKLIKVIQKKDYIRSKVKQLKILKK